MAAAGADRVPTQPEPGPTLVCSICQVRPDGADAEALARTTWSRGVERGTDVWVCDRCSRDHVRGIEGKLDSAWW